MPGPEWCWIAAGLMFPPLLCGFVLVAILHGLDDNPPTPTPPGDAVLITDEIRNHLHQIHRKHRLPPTSIEDISPDVLND